MIEDTRRAPRRQAADVIPVHDFIGDVTIGQLGNISESGMLLLAATPLVDDALYQLQFALPQQQGAPISVGAHLLWSEQANAPGQSWVGFRFIAISAADRERLRSWVDAAPVHV